MINLNSMNIVLFDGVCNFCNSSVQAIIKYDKKDKIKFASQQSEIGKTLMRENGFYNDSLDTIIFFSRNKIFIKTDAVIEICKLLDSFPKSVIILKLIPKKIRDFGYSIFSKHRYKLFGKKNECMIPSIETRNKFLY